VVQYCYQGETKGSVREKGESGKESQGREEERREVIKASRDSPNPLTNL